MLGGYFCLLPLFVLLRQHDFPHYVPGDWRASVITSCNFFSCLLTSKAWQWWEKLAHCALNVLNPCVCPSLLLSSGTSQGCSKWGLASLFSPLFPGLLPSDCESLNHPAVGAFLKSRPGNGVLAKMCARIPNLKAVIPGDLFS